MFTKNGWRQSTLSMHHSCFTIQFLCHCSQLNLSGSLFELYIQCKFLILEQNGLPQRYLNNLQKIHKETL